MRIPSFLARDLDMATAAPSGISSISWSSFSSMPFSKTRGMKSGVQPGKFGVRVDQTVESTNVGPYHSSSFRQSFVTTLTLDGVGRERGVGSNGGPVGIPFGLNPRTDEIRHCRLGEDNPRVGTVLLDVLPRAVEGPAGS